MNEDRTIGTCSICGGAVTVPGVWWSTEPPTPTCTGCGAIAASTHGPAIPMVPAPRPGVTITYEPFFSAPSLGPPSTVHIEPVAEPATYLAIGSDGTLVVMPVTALTIGGAS